MSNKVDLKDANGSVVGYCHNFRLDHNGYTVCDTYITDPTYDMTPIKRTIDLWVEGTNPSPVVNKRINHLLNDIRRMVEEEEEPNPIVVNEGK